MHLSFLLPVILFLTQPFLSVSKHTRHSLNKRQHLNRGLVDTTSVTQLHKRDDTKYVFMHHIVGNTYPYTYDAWVADFTRMGSQIDAVALNVGGDSWQWDRIVDAYNAGAETGMKLFISFDYTSFACDVGTTISWVNTLSSNSAQFKVDGRPMISSYSGYCLGAGGWQNVRNQTGGYLMPFIYGEDDQALSSESTFGFFDSWYCWGCAWPQGNYNKSTADDQYYMSILGNRYATTVSPWMYTHYSYKNFLLRGDNWLINNRWEQLVAMRDQLKFVEMVTWNDFGESDYFGPLTAGQQPDGTTWATGFPHTAFFDLSAYYITAFKTGINPQITNDTIYFWSRPHPAGISATEDPLSPPTGWDWTSDTLWAAAFCSSTCSVILQVGSYSQNFDNLPYGINKISLPLNDYGSVTVIMKKDDQEVINYTPSDFQYQGWTDRYNYNAYIGSATASGATLAATASASAAISGTTSTWTSQGCYVDNSARILQGNFVDQSSMTTETCISTCSGLGFTMAATEYGSQCMCGNSLVAASPADSGDCNFECAGDSAEMCGGNWRANLYTAVGGSGGDPFE